MNSTEIKTFFRKNYGLKVRVRKVAVKTPFFQVWIPCNDQNVYESEFPADVTNLLLRIVYGQDSETGSRSYAGNMERHSISVNEREWIAFTAFYTGRHGTVRKTVGPFSSGDSVIVFKGTNPTRADFCVRRWNSELFAIYLSQADLFQAVEFR